MTNTTTQDNPYASAQETASVIRPATADEAWLHAQLDRLDPHRLEAGGAGDTPALIKLVFEFKAQAERDPMTNDQIAAMFKKVERLNYTQRDLPAFTSGVVCAEVHHKIIKGKP